MHTRRESPAKICPFMSRPASGPGDSGHLCEIPCIRERCMAWVDEYRTHEGNIEAHCRMIQFWSEVPVR